MMRHTKTYALTGNIGTGKSTVAWIFSELGVPVIDSDEVAHEALAPKSNVWKALYERFGSQILMNDEVIDRKILAKIVFKDHAERKFLESLIHPFVKDRIGHLAAAFSKDGHPFVIGEVPLLFEAGWEKDFDAVIVVRCNQENEIKRCIDKFGFTREEVMARLSAQFPLERKIKSANAVIDNDGDIEETRVQVHRLHQDMVKGKF